MASQKKRERSSKSAADPARIAQLIEQCRRGDTAAERSVFAQYVGRLTALARSRLSHRLSARLDADDVVMSAYRSFFIGLRDDRFVISDEPELWQLLVQITLRKVYRQSARHSASKRTVARDVGLFLSNGSVLAIPGREPLPDEAAAVSEETELLLKPLPATARRIVELRLQGEPIDAIARELRVNERTVRRWLNRVKQRLRERLGDSGGKRRPKSARAFPDSNRVVGSQTPTHAGSSCAWPRLPKSLPELKYGDFVLERMIAAGANGKVYRARSRNNGRVYALKFLRKSFLADRAAVERFLAESALVAGFEHPHIARVLGCGRTPQGSYFFAMEMAETDLQRRVYDGRISTRQAVEWILQAARGVQHAHSRGVIHCDLKPSNLLLNGDGRVVVADFGLALRLDHVPVGRRFAGTPAFMSPEQIISPRDGLSVRTDVYGLGATLYALLAGQPPFVSDRASEVLTQIVSSAAPPSIREVRPRLPDYLERACVKCLHKDPCDRFSSVAELIETLEKVRL